MRITKEAAEIEFFLRNDRDNPLSHNSRNYRNPSFEPYSDYRQAYRGTMIDLIKLISIRYSDTRLSGNDEKDVQQIRALLENDFRRVQNNRHDSVTSVISLTSTIATIIIFDAIHDNVVTPPGSRPSSPVPGE